MTHIIGAGGGGKGGGGSSRVAVEAPNTLKSTQYANIIDVISEGQIVGLADGPKSVYLDGIPLQSSNDTYNFTGFIYETRVGTQVQDPVFSALTGTKSTKVNPASSQKLKYGIENGQEVAIHDTRVKAVTIVIGIPTLTYQDTSNGDLNGNTITFDIRVRTTLGSDQIYSSETITGKCTALYQKSYKIPLINYQDTDYPIYIQVVRTKADNDKSNIRDDFYFQTYTEEIPQVLSYPNTALININIDAEQFSNIPTRGYDVYGLIVRIPSNYNPYTRVYTGAWDGTFKLGWTNNPAWIYYDLVLDKRYGIGEFIDESNIDKWGLYTIAKYCDELVSDGRGRQEPRYTCNMVINARDDAYKVLSTVASIFKGMSYWAAGEMHIVADMPKDSVMQFTAANVVDGVFNYSGSSLKTRHTVAQVTWNDPKDQYKQKVEYVEDIDSIIKWGIVQTDIIAAGCTSQAQAHRVGRWLLYTEQLETETITFKTGIENLYMVPGDVIQTSDPNRVGARYGGRIVSIENSIIKLDGEALPTGMYSISIIYVTNTDGKPISNLETKQVYINNNSFTNVFTNTPQVNTIWIATPISTQTIQVKPELWRVLAIKEEESLTATITALAYNPSKFDHIEKNLVLEDRTISSIRYNNPETPQIVEVVDGYDENGNYVAYNTDNDKTWASEHLYFAAPGVISTAVTLSWTSQEPRFYIRWATTGTNDWQEYQISSTSLIIKPVEAGTYDVEIYAINTLGNRSQPLKRTVVILGKIAPPQDVKGISSTKTPLGIEINWNSNKDASIFEYPDLDLEGYELRELYTQSIHPYTITVDDIVRWKTKEELSTYLGIALTDEQYIDSLNTVWTAAHKAEAGIIYNTSYIDISTPIGYNYFLVKSIDTSGNYSILPSITAVSINPPKELTAINARMDGSDLVLSWDKPSSDLTIEKYILNIDNEDIVLYTESYRRKAWFTGTKELHIRSVDIYGNQSSNFYTNITIEDSLAPSNLTFSIVDDISTVEIKLDSVKLSWEKVDPIGLYLPIVSYEVRADLNWGTHEGLLSNALSNTFVTKVTWNNTKRLYVAGITSIGTYTTHSFIDINVIPQGKPTNISSKVVDNNVLLYWNPPLTGSLPIVEYIIKKGTVEATAELIGSKSGNFTSVFETSSGDYTYWIAAKDTAGYIGSFEAVSATVNQPPDYVLQYDYYSSFSGTKTNAILDSNNYLVLPVNSTESWTQHFTTHSNIPNSTAWNSPQDQINAGYPIYIQPELPIGNYQEIIDFGTVLTGNTVTLTTGIEETISGHTVTYKIESRNLDTDPWTLVSESKSGFATNFRYLRITVTVTGGLIAIKSINVKIDSKLKTISGNTTTTVTGGIVYLTDNGLQTGRYIFTDVQSITVTPGFNSGVPAVAIYDFVDQSNPTTFTIHLYRLSDGQEIAGNCSYTVRGV